MDAAPSPVPAIERLLAERAWVRAFARSLVADPAAADDLEQQAWVAALEAPPAHAGSPRGWFATVLRRAASKGRRSAVRVGQRERGAARPEAVPATADVVAQAELEHRVVAAVLALDEPYRTTVLLRWYEGLAPREIAARTGVPVETVRSRAQRALARLRDDLDRAHGGRRSAWAVALLGGRGDGEAERAVEVGGVGGGGAAAWGTRTVLVVAGLALAGAVALVVSRGDPGDPADRAPAVSIATLDAAPAGGAGAHALAGAGPAPRVPVAALPEEPARVPPVDAAAATPPRDPGWIDDVEVNIVEAGVTPDRPIPGSGITWTHRQGSGGGSGPGVAMFGAPPFTGWAWAPGFVPQRFVDVGAVETLRIELTRGVPAQVRFLGEDGQPIPIEELRARYAASPSLRRVNVIPDAPPATWGESIHRSYGRPGAWVLESELLLDQAEPRLRDALGPGRWTLSIPRPGWWSASVVGITAADGTVRFDVALPTPRTTRAHLVAAETGAALAGAQVVPGLSSPVESSVAWTPPFIADTEGFVDLPEPAEGEGVGIWWVFADDRMTVVNEAAWRGVPGPHEVRVPMQATLRGRAFTPAGLPAVGWNLAASGFGFRMTGAVRADGRFELPVPAPTQEDSVDGRPVELTLIDPALSEFGGAAARVHAGDVVEVDIGASSEGRPTAKLTGRLAAGGRALSGRMVIAQGPATPQGPPRNRTAITDAQGRFELAGLEPAAWSIQVMSGGFAYGSGPGNLESEGPLVLRPDEVRPLAIDLPGGRLRVRVLQGAAGVALLKVDVRAIPRERGKRVLAGLSFTPGSLGLSGADGTVVLDGLDPGAPHQVFVTKPGTRERVTVDAVPAAGEVIPEVVVRLP